MNPWPAKGRTLRPPSTMGATMVGEELKILREHLWAIQCHSQQLPPTLGKVVFSRAAPLSTSTGRLMFH